MKMLIAAATTHFCLHLREYVMRPHVPVVGQNATGQDEPSPLIALDVIGPLEQESLHFHIVARVWFCICCVCRCFSHGFSHLIICLNAIATDTHGPVAYKPQADQFSAVRSCHTLSQMATLVLVL